MQPTLRQVRRKVGASSIPPFDILHSDWARESPSLFLVGASRNA